MSAGDSSHLPGEDLERFELIRKLGSGGMGEVHLARDRKTGEQVAVKLLTRPQVEHLRRFLLEAELLARLRIPGIVRYVAHGGAEGGRPFIAMEWLRGIDLADRLKEGPFPIVEALRLTKRAAEILGAAHEAGVVHRDVKPSNFFLPPGGEVEGLTLLDFGVARTSWGGVQLTQTGATLGTPQYMAPEQAKASSAVDGRADLFSLGCILYQCLTGRPAFEGETFYAVFAKIILDDPPPASSLRAEIPEAVDALLSQTLAKSPDERFQSAQALAAALEATIASLEGTSPRGEGASAGVAGEGHRVLSQAEQRAVCVLMGSPGATTAHRTTARRTKEGLRRSAGVARLADELGVSAEIMTDGSFVCAVSGESLVEHAERAAECALRLSEAFPELRLAITTGWATMAGRMPLGDALDRAGRMLSASLASSPDPAGGEGPRAGRITLDEVTAKLVEARYSLERVEESRAGQALLLARRAHAQVARSLLGRATPCVGRRRELRSLEGFFEECAEERVVHRVEVLAKAGLGKSRLRLELTERLEREEPAPTIWLAHGDELGRRASYGVLRKLLYGAIGVGAGAPAERLREALGRHLAGLLPGPGEAEAKERAEDFFGELLGLAGEEPSLRIRAARENPRQMASQLQRALVDWLGATAARAPLVILLEDLHFCDLASIEALTGALPRCRDRGILLVAFGRPQGGAGAEGESPTLSSAALSGAASSPGGPGASGHGGSEPDRPHTLHLRPLSTRASEQFVRATLGEGAEEGQVRAIVDRAEGNPFFLEELVRAAAEGRRLASGALIALQKERLERLDPELRRVLRAASVFGHRFWAEALEALLGARAHSLHTSLLSLVELELLSFSQSPRFAGKTELSFRHALLAEAAYAALTEEDKRLGHRIAARWLEEAGEPDPAYLAEHLERGIEEAADALAAASAWARAAERGPSYAERIARLERGLGYLEGRPLEGPGAAEGAARLSLSMRSARDRYLVRAGQAARLSETCRATLELAKGLGDDEEILLALARLVIASAQLTKMDEAHAFYAEAHAFYGARSSASGQSSLTPQGLIALHVANTLLRFYGGDLLGALPSAVAAAEIAREAGMVERFASAAHNAGNILVCLRRFEEAVPWLERSEEVAGQADLFSLSCENQRLLGFVRAYSRGEEGGRAQVAEALRRAESHDDGWATMSAMYSLALIDHRRGEVEAAKERLEALLRMAERLGHQKSKANAEEALRAIEAGEEPAVKV